MEKTVIVVVEIRHWVNKYRGWKTGLRKYMAHDMENTCNIGDVVKIEQIPHKLTQRKAFNVIEVLQRENIVTEEGSTGAKYQSLAGSLTKRPLWTGLSPMVSQQIAEATGSYSSYYGVSETAHNIARQLPGWQERVQLYQSDTEGPVVDTFDEDPSLPHEGLA